MKNRRKQRIHKDKHGREFIKETYFVGGKMKFHRIYMIDGIPEDEFYEKNATELSDNTRKKNFSIMLRFLKYDINLNDMNKIINPIDNMDFNIRGELNL